MGRIFKFRTPTRCQNGHFRWYFYTVGFRDNTNIYWGEKDPGCLCPTGGMDEGFEKCGDESQWTNLTDKNGNEIFSDDIVKVRILRKFPEETFEHAHVKFGGWCHILEAGNERFLSSLDSIVANECEIIGNIYQILKF